MKSAVICAVLLALFHGNVFAGIRSQGKSNTANEDAKTLPKPGKPAANSTPHFGRILNGTNATIEAYPYIVFLKVKLENWTDVCGASIITSWHAFTAAHCVYKYNASMIKLYGGSTSESVGGIVFNVSRVVVHPCFNPNIGYDNDAAIVRVAETFEGYENIAPIPLQDEEVPAGTWCYVAGWGYAGSEIGYPDNLQNTILIAMSPEACLYWYRNRLSVICAEQVIGGNVCYGDSGGPLVCDGKLTGALSLAGPNCDVNYPSGYAKVIAPAIREFIRQNAGI